MEVKMDKTSHFTDHSSHITDHRIAAQGCTLTLVLLILIAVLASSATVIAVSHNANGGHIDQINFTVVIPTEHWQGYYGTINFTSEPYLDTIEYPYYFAIDVGDSEKIGTIRSLTVAEFLSDWHGGSILATDSQNAPVINNLKAGKLSAIDCITGNGSDSGSRTFVKNTTFYIGYRAIEAPTAFTYVNSSPSTYFRVGFLMDGNTPVFVAPINSSQPGYDSGLYNFQFIIPTNMTNPKTYYMYYYPMPTPSPTPTPKPLPAAGMRRSTNVVRLLTTEQGGVLLTVTVTSKDGIAELTIPKVTIAKDAVGNPLSEIRINKQHTIPSIPPGVIRGEITGIKYACNLEPDGATFSPPITLSIKFDPADFKDATPTIYMYKDERWEALKTTVIDNKAFAKVSHFTIFTLFGKRAVPTYLPTPTITPTPVPVVAPMQTFIPPPVASKLSLAHILGITTALVIIEIVGYYYYVKRRKTKSASL